MIRVTIEIETEEDDIGSVVRRFKSGIDHFLLDYHDPKRSVSSLRVKHIAERYRRATKVEEKSDE